MPEACYRLRRRRGFSEPRMLTMNDTDAPASAGVELVINAPEGRVVAVFAFQAHRVDAHGRPRSGWPPGSLQLVDVYDETAASYRARMDAP